MSESAPPLSDERRKQSNSHTGLIYGLGAYLLWGMFPLYFALLIPANAIEIVSVRVVACAAFCAILLSVARKWRSFLALFKAGRSVAILAAAALLIAFNWGVYAYAVTSNQTIEAALGYFINPLVSVLLAVLVLREKLRPLQWIAVIIGLIAVLELALAYGQVPIIALSLAASFGLYGLLKKFVGSNVDALTSLSMETTLLTPLAIIVTVVMAASGTLTLFTMGPSHVWLMAASGIVTAMPLLLFGEAARRLPLASLGLLQYLTPVLQFLTAIIFFGEHMAVERWIGFGIVWLALIVLTTDMVLSTRKTRRLRRLGA